MPSGIPDFRSPGSGLWENVNPMEVAHIDAWLADPERFWHFYGNRFQTLEDKEPNGAHHALVELERRGKLDAVITQNIDRLHRRAGSQELIEVHGSIDTSSCLTCGARYPIGEVRARLEASPISVPGCDCGEPLKPDVVLFGEWLPEGALERAYALAAGADVLLCIGSSLEVHPIAQLPGVTRQTGGAVARRHAGPDAVGHAGGRQARRRRRRRAAGARRGAVAAPALTRSPQPCSLRRPSVGVERRPLMMTSRPEQRSARRRSPLVTISGASAAIVG